MSAHRLKELLDQFADTLGLAINFSKSTLVPMHVPDPELLLIQSALGCLVEGFPQIYLGMPLSAHKLTLHDFAPLIPKVNKYLFG
jgi:hypothetical protein